MAAPVDVNVNPSSSTQASSGAGSGFGGGLTFAFGGNPNLALLNSAAPGGNWLLIGAGVIGAVLLGLLLLKRR